MILSPCSPKPPAYLPGFTEDLLCNEEYSVGLQEGPEAGGLVRRTEGFCEFLLVSVYGDDMGGLLPTAHV